MLLLTGEDYPPTLPQQTLSVTKDYKAMNDAEFELITSPLSQSIEVAGHTFDVQIYNSEKPGLWILEVVNPNGSSFVWDEHFPSEQHALDAFWACIREEGVGELLDDTTTTPPASSARH